MLNILVRSMLDQNVYFLPKRPKKKTCFLVFWAKNTHFGPKSPSQKYSACNSTSRNVYFYMVYTSSSRVRVDSSWSTLHRPANFTRNFPRLVNLSKFKLTMISHLSHFTELKIVSFLRGLNHQSSD